MANRQIAMPVFAYTGCFTSESRRGEGTGIGIYRVNAETGVWRRIGGVDGLTNPSWLLANAAGTMLYALHADMDYVTSFAIDRATGALTEAGRAKAGGVNGVSAKIDASGKWMVVANYASGHVSVLPIRTNGTLGDAAQSVHLPGEPRPRYRVGHQESSHPHDVMFDPTGRFVGIPDKGLDKTFMFKFDAKRGRIAPAGKGGFINARAGSGPRHMAFHPELSVAWVLNELDSTVTTCRWNGRTGVLSPIEVTLTLPGDFTGDNQTSEIEYVARSNRLYISNRGHDSIAMFRPDRKTGRLKLLGWEKSGGKIPRFFGFDPAGKFFYVANLRGNNIVRFAVDPRTGALKRSGTACRTNSPCAIAFVRTT